MHDAVLYAQQQQPADGGSGQLAHQVAEDTGILPREVWVLGNYGSRNTLLVVREQWPSSLFI